MSEKFSKEEVNYSRGHVHSHCGPTFHDDNHYCKHFIPRKSYLGLCEGVAGDIDPHFWCKRFLRVPK